MMTYFEARRAERVMKAYRDLACRYWNAKPKRQLTGNEWMAGPGPRADPESAESFALREQLNKLHPKVSVVSQLLGVPTRRTSYPAPAIGGPILHGDLLDCVIDQKIGYGAVSPAEVLDVIDKCIGMAQTLQEDLFWKQAVNPLYYIIRATGFILRIPFLILEEAGLPRDVEQSVWARIFKVLEFLALIWVAVHYGLKIDAGALLKIVK